MRDLSSRAGWWTGPILAAAFTGLSSSARAAGAEPPEAAAVRAVWAAVDEAFDARDADRFSRLFTEDVSFVRVKRKEALEGRAAIHAEFARRFPGFSPDVRHATSITSVAALGPGVLGADGKVEILRVQPDGGAPPAVLSTYAIFAVMVPQGEGLGIRTVRVYELPKEATATAARPSAAATLVVLNKAEATASLIDLASGQVAATVPTGQGPHEAAVSPDGRFALVANYGARGAPGSSLTLIDVAEASVVRTIDLGSYQRPHGLAWIDGRRAAVTAEAQKALLIVDVEKGTVESAIETGQDVSHMVALDGKGRAWVASIGSGTATAVSLAAGKVLKTIATGKGAEGIDVTPDGSEAWVTNREDGTVTVIDTATLEPKATLKAGAFPIRATVTPDGRHVLVSNARSADLSVFDAAAKKELRRVPFTLQSKGTEGRLLAFEQGSTPIGIVVRPDGRRAYVAHAGADVISIVDLVNWRVVGTLTAGKEPDGMALSPVAVRRR